MGHLGYSAEAEVNGEERQPGIGPCLMPSQPINFTGLDRESTRPAPVLGEHTDEILAEILGLSDVEIGQLHDSGLVAGVE